MGNGKGEFPPVAGLKSRSMELGRWENHTINDGFSWIFMDFHGFSSHV
jgi:hypothetical protein